MPRWPVVETFMFVFHVLIVLNIYTTVITYMKEKVNPWSAHLMFRTASAADTRSHIQHSDVESTSLANMAEALTIYRS